MEEEAKIEEKNSSQVDDLIESNTFDNISGIGEKKKKKKHKKKHKKRKDEDKKEKKSALSNDKFMINGTYSIIKMLGFGAFGEIHLAYDTSLRVLRAIKFEMASHKNPQLKHEYGVLEQLNKVENNVITQNPEPVIGIPKVYFFDRMDKYNYLVMDLLGPNISDLFQLKDKVFSLETVLLIAIQMLTRIEFIHEKGFLHRDIKPENFVIGINEKSNLIHIVDFGLSKRYKDKNSGQHIPYRENRHLVGTVRYASINAHLGIEQSRRDDIEGIGYVLVYLYFGRLPWQGKQDKGKPQVNKIMEKKLITPPEILCKKMPVEFSYYFHYCRNLKFEDRPDYNTLKSLFVDLLSTRINLKENVIFDWFDEDNSYKERKRKELQLSGRKTEDELAEEKKKFQIGNLDELDHGIKEESKEESNIKDIKNENSRNKEIQEEQKQNEIKSSISSASDDKESKKKANKKEEDLISEEKDKEKDNAIEGLIEDKNSVSTDVVKK